ncbi:MAG TPA: hypothetical protein VMB53_03830 [Gaiellaceae bacterium]|nr:hypothetical protein [Gaiellaceae bacterium]
MGGSDANHRRATPAAYTMFHVYCHAHEPIITVAAENGIGDPADRLQLLSDPWSAGEALE